MDSHLSIQIIAQHLKLVPHIADHSFAIRLACVFVIKRKADLMGISAFSSADWFRSLVAFLIDGLPLIGLKGTPGFDTSFCHLTDWSCLTYKYVMIHMIHISFLCPAVK